MKTKTLSFPKKAVQLATGLAIGAAVLAFVATDSRAEDSFYGDTAQQTDFDLKYGESPYYGRTIVPRKVYRYRPYRGRYVRYREPYYNLFFGPRYHRYSHHYVRYHHPFADPFYRPYGYGFGFRIR